MKLSVVVVAAAVAATALQAVAETHIGFDTERVEKDLLVSEIYESSLAFASGVREGDAIVSIGASSVRSPKDVARLTAGRKVGDSVRVRIKRGGQLFDVRVPLVDGEDMRKRSAEAKRTRKETAEKAFDEQQQKRAAAEAAAIAEDPELPKRLDSLLDEWEFMAESMASWAEKSLHCDKIADCYLKLRNKDEYKRWKAIGNSHRQIPPAGGRRSWP